jgi:hypothetical protein
VVLIYGSDGHEQGHSASCGRGALAAKHAERVRVPVLIIDEAHLPGAFAAGKAIADESAARAAVTEVTTG